MMALSPDKGRAGKRNLALGFQFKNSPREVQDRQPLDLDDLDGSQSHGEEGDETNEPVHPRRGQRDQAMIAAYRGTSNESPHLGTPTRQGKLMTGGTASAKKSYLQSK
jgi:hypothetical protein